MDLVSQCSLRVASFVWRPGHGGFAFTVVCKATFELKPDISLLTAEQEPVTLMDAYAGERGELAVASDLVPLKTRPEVLVSGHAYAPEGRPVTSLTTRVQVGEIDKSIQIVGDQFFGLDGWLCEPASFTRMPLRWERAAGGIETLNPLGRALGGAALLDGLGRVPAPNLLPPGARIRTRSDVVPPVGFGPIAPLWPSRTACLRAHQAGWDPKRWHERPLPVDLDLGYFNAAPPDQRRTLPFGDEAIYLENLHPRFAQLSTRLAPVTPVATVDQGSGPQPLQLRCDTLTIDTDRGLVMLVWRAHALLDHPDRPGSVVITTPSMVPASVQGWALNAPAGVDTVLPTTPPRVDAVLPFTAAAPSTRDPAASPCPDAAANRRLAQLTLVPGNVVPAAVLPFAVRQGLGVLAHPSPPAESAPDLPFKRPSGDDDIDGPITPPRLDPIDPPASQAPFSRAPVSWASQTMLATPTPVVLAPWSATEASPVVTRPVDEVPPPDPALAPPAPPELIGPIVVVPDQAASAPADEVPVVAAAVEAEVETPVEAYTPLRCGALAARLQCADGDDEKAGALLRAEELDPTRWQRVHEHWLDRIREEAARSRKKLMVEYDDAYVGALEAERGAIALETYARLADAAERGEVSGALSEGGLPGGAWPHIHRVWIGKMVKDVRLGKRVRAAIDAQREG